jgi:hypothetical protein
MNLKDIATSPIEWQLISVREDAALVREIQQNLLRLGFNPGTANGIWTASSQSAYQSFAKANQLNVTVLTPKAAKLLLQPRPTPQPTPRPTSSSQSSSASRPSPSAPTTQPSPSASTVTPSPAPPPSVSPSPVSKKVTDSDYLSVAQLLGCDGATIRAVVEIESSGSGFLADGRPKILFEAHWFSEFTQGKFDVSHRDISSARWNPDLYLGGAREWIRLERAMQLDRKAALQSASWGLGQIMGFNFKAAGYADIEQFVRDMHLSEGKQLMAMFNFIKSQKLDQYLIKRDWAGFALRYNGMGYQQNRYDEKLAVAYQKWMKLEVSTKTGNA